MPGGQEAGRANDEEAADVNALAHELAAGRTTDDGQHTAVRLVKMSDNAVVTYRLKLRFPLERKDDIDGTQALDGSN